MAIAHQKVYPSAQSSREALEKSTVVVGTFYVPQITQPVGSAPGELEARAINSGDTD